ncbi:hypothetical protein SDC9_70133 [bioreactor metagenome]|uniref:Uncharacterized protein n=1 Tax=bioreactor metagenome TaxID=1076179 RepID=A0A644Y5T0_9ZZZZ
MADEERLEPQPAKDHHTKKDTKRHIADPYDVPLPNLSERAKMGIRNNPMISN